MRQYSLILSQLDYYNVLYAGAPEYLVKRLQIIINTAVRVVADRLRFRPIIGYIRDVLHWLPAAQRIDFKIATLAIKALNGQAPSYLIDLDVKYALPSRRPVLRSSSEIRLVINRHSNKYAERAFAVVCTLT